ncbi:CocE/NonD family hydrolase [Rhodococcus sp. IEGM 1330]|uniref:CocE/NonD family hydrolase n=1 Tax=Rhodococcus sp. IEGM 1330 TaxID=3082225 RepID=UPI002953F053|nr:CocE/NonD family hydrolase [Rhodococcus sp. IEGM 1330]MDV8020088.1 CocE/NonD family hydrolase [Rhodococcus sp. IEGM 1330]
MNETTPSPKVRYRVGAVAAALPLVFALAACAPETAPVQVATDTGAVTHSGNDRVPEGASWTQHFFPSSVPSSPDGTEVELHADVLLPEDLPEGEKLPVILSVGSYFGHSGQIGVEDFEHTGPSDRFGNLIEEGDIFDRGYALVMVDLRGFGGSNGCLDFIGTGEQADVEAAIDWAATQPWSTGSVGMYGKSYDAITGLVGNNLDQDSLKAVVAQEPIWDLYRNNRSNGVPRSPMVLTANSYNTIAKLPQMPDDDERYRANADFETANPGCEVVNSLGYQTADPNSDFWSTRDLAARSAGTDTPLLFTQGLLEWNTEAEAMDEFLANHDGVERGWLGPWDHVRGDDRDENGTLKMGREGWIEEVMSFYDQHLKGIEPSAEYPAYAIQDNTGTWRAQDTWPVSDTTVELPIGGGTYLDDGAEGDPADETGNSFILRSTPLAADTRITITPRISLDAVGHGNVMVKLYDVAPDGTAILFDEQVSPVKTGPVAMDLKSTDWTIKSGNALAVQIGTIEAGPLGDWIDTPSNETITVTNARLQLALDDPADDTTTQGERALFLDTYLSFSTIPLPDGEPSFNVPPARG